MNDRSVPWRHRFEYGLVRIAGWAVAMLPDGAARALGRTLGALARLAGVRVGVARANLARAFPERSLRERERILRGAYAQAGLSAIEILRFPRLTPQALDPIVSSIAGFEHVKAARALGRGVVLLTGHYGAAELMGAAVARHGHPMHFLVRGQSNALVDADLQARRAALGVGVVPHGAGVRGVLRALRENACVALIADQDAGRRGVFVDFFGAPASTPPGPAEFALRAGAPLVMGCLVRELDGRYHGRFFPPLTVPPSGDHAADVRALTALHVRMLEEWIRERPEQWLWMHRRWKTPAPGGAVPGAVRPAAPAAAFAALLVMAALAPASFAPTSPIPPGAPLALPAAESAFDGAGSSVFPLSEARVRRVFEDVRIRRIDGGWAIDAEEIFQAGVAPARAAMGLPDYRASVEPDTVEVTRRGTVRGLRVTVDGLPMGVSELPGSAAPGEDLGGIERLYRWEVPFSAEEIRTVRLSYSVGDSRTDRGEPLLFFYLNPGSLWDGEAAKVTASVDLGAVDPEDLIPGWLRPGGYRVYGTQVIWRRGAGDAVADLALAYRPWVDDLLAAFPDRQKGPFTLGLEAREEWFERLTVRETRYWAAFLRARRGAPVDSTGPAAGLARERWYRPAAGYRDDRLPREERTWLGRLEDRLAAWRRAQIPLDSAAVQPAGADST
ncbi:MAG: lysophospholipid acyltransferase family protein [Candidatus Eisenbacteria bacterium]